MEAVVEAKEAGKMRYIGFTGHKDPRIHLYMLEMKRREHGFHLTRCKCRSTSWTRTFAALKQLVVPELVKQNIGVLGMKSFGGGIILKSGVVAADGLPSLFTEPSSVRMITGIQHGHAGPGYQSATDFQPLSEARWL